MIKYISTIMVSVSLLSLIACDQNNDIGKTTSNVTILPLKNPSFEASDEYINGWSFSQHAGAPAYDARIDTNNATEGKNSYRIERQLVQFWGMINQWLPLNNNDGQKVTLTAMVKGSNLGKQGFTLGLIFRRSNRKVISSLKSTPVTGNSDWHQVELSGIVPPNTKHLQITAVLNDDGVAWLDDVQLSLSSQVNN